ncbi:thiamine phosphate synthase [Candidatus Vallotiella sp. (ex Adelges kitamiensis)]|uniref:thiamine phosphate synthase n=1 Tax=Candidatus Vallotiella sp. (ex Adelges kitamiensis) TaxID=2864217 RepID=UPI001CE2BAA7|nr:thiamine phosphate synthase [Candidatus Vallotia sp. (ex Adelges kitamiensis)]
MSNFLLWENKIFYPASDKLLKTTKQIRAKLGDWPHARQPIRICFMPLPPFLGQHDVIIATGSRLHATDITFWVASGAAVLDASASTTIRLYRGDTIRILEASSRCDDWISALAAFIDCGYEIHDALCLALAWRHGDEHKQDPWPTDLSRFPRVLGLPDAPILPFAKCPERLGLYPIVPTANWIVQLLPLGVRTVQLRQKVDITNPYDLAALQADVHRAVIVGQRYKNARVFINDYWQLALKERAYGVHLGQEDLWYADINALMQAGIRLGISSHGYYEILVALHFKPSYIALGAVFPTSTKMMPSLPQGLTRLARYVHFLDGKIPCVAIGGIDLQSLNNVLSTGVRSAAVVRAVTQAHDVEKTIFALQSRFMR